MAIEETTDIHTDIDGVMDDPMRVDRVPKWPRHSVIIEDLDEIWAEMDREEKQADGVVVLSEALSSTLHDPLPFSIKQAMQPNLPVVLWKPNPYIQQNEDDEERTKEDAQEDLPDRDMMQE